MSFLVDFMNWFSEKQPTIHGDSVSAPIISWVQLSPTFFWECWYIREWAVTLVFSLENKIRSVRVNIFGYYLTRVSKNLKKHQPRGNVLKVLLQKKKKHIATLAPIELKQSQHNLITAVTHHVPNLPVLSHTRWSRLTSRSNFQRENIFQHQFLTSAHVLVLVDVSVLAVNFLQTIGPNECLHFSFTTVFIFWSFSHGTGWMTDLLRSSLRICRACNSSHCLAGCVRML